MHLCRMKGKGLHRHQGMFVLRWGPMNQHACTRWHYLLEGVGCINSGRLLQAAALLAPGLDQGPKLLSHVPNGVVHGLQ